MSQFDRIYRIHDILRNACRPVPMRRFKDELEASRNTITRDFEYLRDTLGAPLIYSREHNGHHYDPDSPTFELPGFWMNASELYALLACEQLLETVQPGMMTHRLAPLKKRIRHLLGETGHNTSRISECVQIQPMQVRTIATQVFDPVAEATLSGQQLFFRYSGRNQNRERRRQVHPQRLLHYRSNWYLLAHCQEAGALRLFSLDRIEEPKVAVAPAQCIPANELDHYTSQSFGIFAGKPRAWADLVFTHHAARWVADEQWHPDQVSEWREAGYCLRVPYSDSTELIMDIMRYGPTVEVVGPPDLRAELIEKVKGMQKVYW